jgi:hypothetical protein
VRKVLLFIGLLVALAVPAGAAAAKDPIGNVICGTACDGGGGGWTGCTQATASDSQGIPWIAHIHHYLVVNYCKSNGSITSLSITAHGCDYQGTVYCTTGPAWIVSGGVGTGWASVTGHATYIGALAGTPWAGTSVVNLDIPLG